MCLHVHVSKLNDMYTHSQKLRIRCVFTRNCKWRTLTLECTHKKKIRVTLLEHVVRGGGLFDLQYSNNEAIKIIIHVPIYVISCTLYMLQNNIQINVQYMLDHTESDRIS